MKNNACLLLAILVIVLFSSSCIGRRAGLGTSPMGSASAAPTTTSSPPPTTTPIPCDGDEDCPSEKPHCEKNKCVECTKTEYSNCGKDGCVVGKFGDEAVRYRCCDKYNKKHCDEVSCCDKNTCVKESTLCGYEGLLCVEGKDGPYCVKPSPTPTST